MNGNKRVRKVVEDAWQNYNSVVSEAEREAACGTTEINRSKNKRDGGLRLLKWAAIGRIWRKSREELKDKK